MLQVKYDIQKYDFKTLFEDILEVDDLTKIYTEDYELLTVDTDWKTIYHERFHTKIEEDDTFYTLYKEFIKEIVSPVLGFDFIYQRIPNFRVHMIGNVAVGDWHKDADYNHSVDEMNIFLPITNAFGNNTFWVREDKEFPVECEYGNIIKWNSSVTMHGNKINDTDSSRVSIDFRFLPKDKYNLESVNHSYSHNKKFIIGEYWDV